MNSPRRSRADRIVKPRKTTTNAQRPVIFFDIDSQRYITEEGETGDYRQFTQLLFTAEPSIIVSRSSFETLVILNETFQHHPTWNANITQVKRRQFQPRSAHTGHRLFQKCVAVNWFGWSGAKKHEKNKYHFCLDPVTFSSFRLNSHEPESILKWGIGVRDFCVKEQLNVRPTQGALARQFLKDKRFYPEPRRKVPRATNDKVRHALPGGLFEVGKGVYSNREYSGYYLDQSKAHHYHAIHTKLPDSNTLYAFGRFRADYDKIGTRPWRKGERVESFLHEFSGLVYGQLSYNYRPGRWVPPILHDVSKPVYWWTSERGLLDSLGAKPVNIIAAWGSHDNDTGLERFAEYAISLQDIPDFQKPILLSAYGTLASTARKFSTAFFRSKGGKIENILFGKHSLPAHIHETNHVSEPITNNVLHLGLIEAATRTESLLCANWLQSKNFTVLMIYVDGVIVMNKGRELPLIPDPWRLKTPLTHLRFLSNNAFISDEMRRIPGGQTRQEALNFRPSMPNSLSHLLWNRDRYKVKRVNGVSVSLRSR